MHECETTLHITRPRFRYTSVSVGQLIDGNDSAERTAGTDQAKLNPFVE